MRVVGFVIVIAIFFSFTMRNSYAAATPTVNVNATVLSKNQCKFNTAGTTLTFSPNLDPMNPTIRTLSVTIPDFFVCKGSSSTASYLMTDNGGIRNNHTLLYSGVLIPYTFSYTPSSGNAAKNVDQDLTIDVTIHPDNYQDAIAGGPYTDIVTLTIVP